MSIWTKLLIGFNIFLLVVVLSFVISGKYWFRNLVRDKIIGLRHIQFISMFEACPPVIGAIIFLGDSITEGGRWSELFPDKKVLNRGIGGDVTAGVLARIEEVVRHQPSKLFIAIGTNDLAMGKSNEEIIENYRAIIQKVQEASSETQIFVQSVLPVGSWVILGHDNKKIVPLNEELKEMCADLSIPYIDLFPHFLNSEGYLDKQFSNDRLHLLGNAYLVWKEQIEEYVYQN